MLYVDSDVINLTCGDDAVLSVSLKTDDGNDYDMSAREYLIFSVRKEPSDESGLLIEIESEPGTSQIRFTHADTVDVPPGLYSAEIQLMTEDNQRITVWPMLYGSSRYTVKNRNNFCLMNEVVYR